MSLPVKESKCTKKHKSFTYEKQRKTLLQQSIKFNNFHYYYFCTFAPLKNLI